MADPITTARTARESLARGLTALQSDPNIPAQFIELAAPIAQAMGALHKIERSNGAELMPHADVALQHVRTVLSSLQAQPTTHPAVGTAMEAVASSLGLVHSLSRMVAPAQAPQAQPAPSFPQPQQQAYAPPQQQQQMPQQAFAPQAQPQQARPQQQIPQAQPVQARPQPQYAPQPQPAPMAAQDPFRAPIAQPKPGEAQVINADLGAHSTTNFYKGLSGNDIIDHGGLFVSTYMVPKIGTPVRLKVSLPGGYEFEANAVVRWAREQSDAGNDAPPGFGAQFTQITTEARQLVYRYVRNREPLFHDDL